MENTICIRDYSPQDVQDLANIYFHTIHRVNIQHYTEKEIDLWAPKTSLETEGWAKKFLKLKPLVAVIGDKIVGFAEFEPNGHIDCFYVHHAWIGKGAGKALMKEIFARAEHQRIERIFAEVSITARPFFENQGFTVLEQQTNKNGLRNYKMEKILKKKL